MDDLYLQRLRTACLPLPEAAEERCGAHTRFLIRGRTFAWLTVDHHGDGRVAVSCKAAPGVPELLVATDGARFFIPPYLGPKGWLGIYLDVGNVDWEEVADLVTESYRLIAPKRLAARCPDRAD